MMMNSDWRVELDTPGHHWSVPIIGRVPGDVLVGTHLGPRLLAEYLAELPGVRYRFERHGR